LRPGFANDRIAVPQPGWSETKSGIGATRIVGFFVSAIGVGLIINGVIEVLETHGFTSLH
jgi:hypothetical protein